MVNIILIHGFKSNPENHWFPSLKKELESIGQKVIVPKFPTPDGQSLESWLEVFEHYKMYMDKNTIVVGHSLGVSFLLNVIEQSEVKIKAAFFVSGFVGLLGKPEFDELNRSISDVIFDWKLIHRHCEKFYVYHSDNDPYVPVDRATYLTKKLSAKYKLIKEAGHFNKESGYEKFDVLLDDIKLEL